MSGDKKGWRIEVIDHDTEKAVHTVPCTSKTTADQADSGMQHNLDHDKYYTLVKGPDDD